DGDPATREDQQEIARIDQQRFADGSGDPLPSKPLWSGFKEAGVHTFTPYSILLLRGGEQGTAITADTLILQAPGAGGTQPRLLGPVKADGNEDRFPPVKATALRFTIEKTNNGNNPCIDELEIWAGVMNVARQARPSSSGNYLNNPKHKLEHINDGKYGNGRSWISNEGGRGWVQLEWDEPAVIERITWARDREKQYSDRVPAVYRIEVRENEDAPWVGVAGSQARVGGPKGEDAALNLAGLPPKQAAEAKKLLDRIKPLEAERAALLKNPMVYAGTFRQPREPTRRLFRGDPLAPREVVAPDGIVVLNERLGSFQLSPDAPEQKRRVALAKWIIHPDNPLTARVIVNRLWHYHFGRGIVATPSDFGDMGFRPTHPQLLDWLASELKENGWSLKHIHRLILTSKTYAQSSSPQNQALEKDAGSQWLWRFPPRRLEAEAIRDNILLVAGSLNRTMYGPSYSLFEPNTNYSRNWVPKQKFENKDLRRMVYALKLRMEHDAIFGAFDCPDGGSIAPVRSRSTTPIQALNLYNSAFVLDQARRFAERAREAAVDASAAARVQAVFHLAFGRGATPAEVADAAALVEQHGLDDLCRAVFNANEFLFMP
ncbi:MAG: DUF1553 domain-containing protein, partial [Phycisphaerae bacterium]|nr:DUF1553 domain-containing protein [Phycisphaerae bacterium]